MRTLETAPAIEPPRVPFVSVFPQESLDTREPVPAAPPPSHAEGRAPFVRVDPITVDGLAEPRAQPGREHVSTDAPPKEPARRWRGDVEEARQVENAAPRISERLVERRVEITSRRDDSERSPVERLITEVAVEPAAVVREVHETHHHHWIEPAQAVDRAEHVAPPPRVVPAVPTRTPQPPPVSPARGERAAQTPHRPPRVRHEPQEAVRAESPAPPQPSVHVAIGRITVRVQPPAATGGTPTTRPTPPALDLETYTAARRPGKR
jgi:hypothetical protein